MDLEEIAYNIMMECQEQEEEFIFTKIQPFCEYTVQTKISKQELKNALLLYEKAKQLLGVKK